MATHVENKQPNTLIQNSPINVNTLNVNKTSTEEHIISILPRYHIVDPTTHTNYEFDISPQMNLELKGLFKLFINGNLIPKADTLADDGVYLYPTAAQFKVIGSTYTDLIDQAGVLIHTLYTPIGE